MDDFSDGTAYSAMQLARNDPDKAMKNSDNYMWFVLESTILHSNPIGIFLLLIKDQTSGQRSATDNSVLPYRKLSNTLMAKSIRTIRLIIPATFDKGIYLAQLLARLFTLKDRSPILWSFHSLLPSSCIRKKSFCRFYPLCFMAGERSGS